MYFASFANFSISGFANSISMPKQYTYNIVFVKRKIYKFCKSVNFSFDK